MAVQNSIDIPSVSGTAVVGTGTGFSTLGYTTTPTASNLSERDGNANLSANNMISGYATTATAAGTTTLTVASAQQQYFTGSTTQTVVLPVTSTLVLGQSFAIVNNSTGVVTVQSSGANAIQAMAAATQLIVTVINTGVTTAAGWSAVYLDIGSGNLPTNPPSSHTATVDFGAITLGVARRNTLGYPIMVTVGGHANFDTGSSLISGVGPTSSPTTDVVISNPSAIVSTFFSVSQIVPVSYYLLVNTSGTVTIFSTDTQVTPL